MSCKVCGDTEGDIKTQEYFNCFVVSLCPKCYLDWIRYYYSLKEYEIYREMCVRLRSLEKYIGRVQEELMILKAVEGDREFYQQELKMAKLAEKYFKENGFDS